jgi:diphosphomevalonate decarboxylase
MSEAVAVAHPNIALTKYWGKRPGAGRFPAVPSLSVTLAGLSTRTRVRFDEALAADRVVLNGVPADGDVEARAVELLDRVRAASGDPRFAEVESRNDFPTASGLASSASGFAALALAAARASGLAWDPARVSDLARQSSVSAARSLFGGYVELDAGTVACGSPASDFLAARPIAPGAHLPLAVLVCVTSEGPKAIGSTTGMQTTLNESPYAEAWLSHAPRLHARLRAALLARDFAAMGALAESSALAMHASAIAAGVVYWTGATLEALQAVRGLRAAGVLAFATVDAGPHVKILVQPEDAARVKATAGAVPGVRRVIEASIGEGARIEARAVGARAEAGVGAAKAS